MIQFKVENNPISMTVERVAVVGEGAYERGYDKGFEDGAESVEIYQTKYGRIYTPYVDYTGTIFNTWYISHAVLAETEHLIEVNFAGWSKIEVDNSNPLQNSGVQRAYFPNLASSTTYICENCKNLVECVLGGIGYPVTSLYFNAFRGCTQSDLTITVYVNATTLADVPKSAPWGATNATIIYRNSTTGEVITE